MPNRKQWYQTRRLDPAKAAAEAQGATGGHVDTDCTLMRQVAAGDHQAFETLYHRYAPRLTGYLTPLLWQRELVEEVHNDVMLALWHQASRFNPDMRLSTWLFGMARHKALSALRTAKQPPAGRPAPPAWGDQPPPEERVTRQERRRQVACALQTLPPTQRAVIKLAYYQGRSYQEIATLLVCPVNTVKTRLWQARRRLAPTLAGLGLAPAPSLGGEGGRARRSVDRGESGGA